MILGVGIDLVEHDRFAATLERHGQRFLERVFTARERAEGTNPRRPAHGWAARFAAKEAVFKALAFPGAMAWHEIELVRQERPFPEVVLGRRYEAYAAKRGPWRFHLSITHSRSTSTAVALWEGLPYPDKD